MRKSASILSSAALGAAVGLTLATIELTVARISATPGSFFVVPRHLAAAIAMEMLMGAALAACMVSRPRLARFFFALGVMTISQWGLWGSRWILNRYGFGTHWNIHSALLFVAVAAGLTLVYFLFKRLNSGYLTGIVGALLVAFSFSTAHWVRANNESDDHYRANYDYQHPGAAAPPRSATPPSGAKNVLVIVVDTLRADALGSYGNTRKLTPILDKLAGRGVRFADVTSTSSWTRPAVATLWTGKSPREHGVNALVGNLSEDLQTIPERFRDLGYRTFAVVSNPILKKHFGFGQGFDVFDDRTHATDAAYFMAGYAPAFVLGVSHERTMTRSDRAANVVERVLRQVAGQQPFFAWVHFFDPHAPYDPPEAYKKKFVRTPIPHFRYGYDKIDLDLTEDKSAFESYVNLYEAEVRYLDDELGRLFGALLQRGLDRNTVVVFLSDHGEQFREHGGLLHGYSLYQEEVRIPLIVAGPGLPKGAVVNRPMSLVELPDTLLELAGASSGEPAHWKRLLDDQTTDAADIHADVDAELHGIDVALSSVRAGSKKRILDRNADRVKLFDLAIDPAEQNDMTAVSPPWAADLTDRQSAFDKAFPRAPRGAVEIDPAAAEALRSLGYIQ